MAVAWIGDRDVPVAQAAKHAAGLLVSSLSPVFSFDTDVHGTRAAIALAERVGAAYDHIGGEALARETALFTDKGGMFIAPGETRRRADVVVIAGSLPAHHHEFVAELASTVPDLGGGASRQFFLIGAETKAAYLSKAKPTRLAVAGAGIDATLAALRAQCAGRGVAKPVSNFERFAKALAEAKFPVFLFCGQSLDLPGLDMLQGLIADINRKSRASALHLPASESGWGSTLASTWMTGFPMRTGFARGMPELDPWRFDVARMLAAGEADLHLWTSAKDRVPSIIKGVSLIALTKGKKPAAGAAVTISIGEPGVDHDAVAWSSRIGTLAAVKAQAATDLPDAASVLRLIAEHLPDGKALPC
ncbi:tungsten formylmethanofuran dehydrogenase [Mesorhizobium sp. YR577]|uniref:tungsten formylmethanofuran dehydrogenase n=1 Tax=Mesorhizobium sp. YR577 TaxID=1884373 RepID=UPI0008E568DC|nr:tungsten formylmethanofuran dehydrogenase [Mesorhizobium sp. YR577]SFT87027.1 formylmethanofuran dehydrogenase, subunit B /formyltransferase/hydrolase complex subunit B [Mesorhizobium sp. YR577]